MRDGGNLLLIKVVEKKNCKSSNSLFSNKPTSQVNTFLVSSWVRKIMQLLLSAWYRDKDSSRWFQEGSQSSSRRSCSNL